MYKIDGTMVKIIAEIENVGFIIVDIYVDSEGSTVYGDEYIYKQSLYKTPPQKKQHRKIEELNEEILELNCMIEELKDDLRKKSEYNEMKAYDKDFMDCMNEFEKIAKKNSSIRMQIRKIQTRNSRHTNR